MLSKETGPLKNICYVTPLELTANGMCGVIKMFLKLIEVVGEFHECTQDKLDHV